VVWLVSDDALFKQSRMQRYLHSTSIIIIIISTPLARTYPSGLILLTGQTPNTFIQIIIQSASRAEVGDYSFSPILNQKR
jgi:hypothetical protein